MSFVPKGLRDEVSKLSHCQFAVDHFRVKNGSNDLGLLLVVRRLERYGRLCR